MRMIKLAHCFTIFAVAITANLMLPHMAQAGFVHASGTSLSLDGKTFIPVGVGHMDVTSLWVATNTTPTNSWVTENDFKNLSRAGFNSMRLAVKTDYFQDPKPPHAFNAKGFAWLDQRMVWAKRYGMRLILDMHMPTGGTPQDYRVTTDAQAFWADPWLKGRFVDVWREIARRYANEQAIWAYDMMNEPATWDYAAYERLMRDTSTAIRKYDKNHVIIVQPGMFTSPTGSVELMYPNVAINNAANSLHFYQPVEFTHFGVYWGVTGKNAKTSYPDSPTTPNAWSSTTTKLAFFAAYDLAADTGRPVVLTEFGTVFHARETGQVRWLNDVLDAARAKKTGWHYWYYKGPAYIGEMGLTVRYGQPRPRTWALLKKYAAQP